MKIHEIFGAAKYTILVAIFSALLGQLLMLFIGVVKVYTAIKFYLLKEDLSEFPEHIYHSDVATAYLIQSLDAFLVAVVLMYFAFSLFHLYLSKNTEASAKLFPGNKAPKNISELKQILAEVIIVILFILFLQEIWVELNNMQWNLLIAPISIALLALSLRLVNFKDK